ncbi:hypothetical protein ENBRE01_0192 [Enteropsectra breve]|nr:hypothetical protein ENBRE01_0192 [Enteropsectra breve]
MKAILIVHALAWCITQDDGLNDANGVDNLDWDGIRISDDKCLICNGSESGNSRILNYFRGAVTKVLKRTYEPADEIMLQCVNEACSAKFHASCIIGRFESDKHPRYFKKFKFSCPGCQVSYDPDMHIIMLIESYATDPKNSTLEAISLLLEGRGMKLIEFLLIDESESTDLFINRLSESKSPCAERLLAQIPLFRAIKEKHTIIQKLMAIKKFAGATRNDHIWYLIDVKLDESAADFASLGDLEKIIVDLAKYTKDFAGQFFCLVTSIQILRIYLQQEPTRAHVIDFLFGLLLTEPANFLLAVDSYSIKAIGPSKSNFILQAFYNKLNNPELLNESLQNESLYFSMVLVNKFAASVDSSGYAVMPFLLKSFAKAQKFNLEQKYFIENKNIIAYNVLRNNPGHSSSTPLFKLKDSKFKASVLQIVCSELMQGLIKNPSLNDMISAFKLFVFYERRISLKPDIYLPLDIFTRGREDVVQNTTKLISHLKENKCFYELELLMRHSPQKENLSKIIEAFSNAQLAKIFERKVHITPETEDLIFETMEKCGYLKNRNDFFMIGKELYICFTVFKQKEINLYFSSFVREHKFSETGCLALAVTDEELLTGRSEEEIFEWCENYQFSLPLKEIHKNAHKKCQHLFIYLYVDPLLRYLERTLCALVLMDRRMNVLRMLEAALCHCRIRDVKHLVCAILNSGDAYFYLNALLLRSDNELKNRIMEYIFSEISNEGPAPSLGIFFEHVNLYFTRYHESRILLKYVSDRKLQAIVFNGVLQNIEELKKVSQSRLIYDEFIKCGKDLITTLKNDYSEYYDQLKININQIPQYIVHILTAKLADKRSEKRKHKMLADYSPDSNNFPSKKQK